MVRSILHFVVATIALSSLPSVAMAQRYYIGSSPIQQRYPFYYSTYGNGQGFNYLTPPRAVWYDDVYPTRVVDNSATRGTVIEYTHNGNGYISTPGSSYQTVISSGPPIYPFTTVTPTTQPPVVIETRPLSATGRTSNGNPTPVALNGQIRGQSQIQLTCPKESRQPLSYILNGTSYTIKPGYMQTFPDDRPWTIAFLRAGSGSEVLQYELTAGNYRFVADQGGWHLEQYPQPATRTAVPPSPVPIERPTDIPAPAPTPGL